MCISISLVQCGASGFNANAFHLRFSNSANKERARGWRWFRFSFTNELIISKVLAFNFASSVFRAANAYFSYASITAVLSGGGGGGCCGEEEEDEEDGSRSDGAGVLEDGAEGDGGGGRFDGGGSADGEEVEEEEGIAAGEGSVGALETGTKMGV